MVLALDLGTTAVKAAVVSAQGELLALDAEPQPLILTPDGGVEQDPRIWWATLTRLVQRLLSKQADAGAGGLRFLPWLVGERTPVENPHVRGGFCRLSLQHGRAELARAVLEGVALNARWLLDAVERLAGRRLEPIRLVGGGARSTVWAQILADVLQRELWQMAQPQMATVRGAGMLAAIALGWTDWQSLERCTPVQARFAPDPARVRLYDAMYREFRARYRVESRRWAS